MKCYKPVNRHDRKATWFDETHPHPGPLSGGEGIGSNGRWRAYDYVDLVSRDKASLDIFWLKDESLSESDNLPAPEVIAQEIVEDLEAALELFRDILADIGPAMEKESL
ncbi:MAG TPA: hypothetical protein VNL74_11715 [Methylococcus sp.]|nr:hypothetical protein [Methylococcus sp.]